MSEVFAQITQIRSFCERMEGFLSLSRDIVNILRILYKFLVQTTDYITILVPTFFSLTIKNICLMTEDTSLFILIQGFPVYNRA